jgi:hypothetical protein
MFRGSGELIGVQGAGDGGYNGQPVESNTYTGTIGHPHVRPSTPAHSPLPSSLY